MQVDKFRKLDTELKPFEYQKLVNGDDKFTLLLIVWGKSKEEKELLKNNWIEETIKITKKYYESYFYNIIEVDNADEEYFEMNLHCTTN